MIGTDSSLGRLKWQMSPRARRWTLILHLISSVGWLGLTIGYVTLAITSVTADRPEIQHGAVRMLGVFGEVLLIPVSLLSLATGLIASLGTRWRLIRHKWVFAKFALSAVAVVLTAFSQVPLIGKAVAVVELTPHGLIADLGTSGRIGLLAAGFVSITMYTTCTVLAVGKPWGRTRWGRPTAASDPASN